MSSFSDDEGEMTIRRPLPDATVEAVLTGGAVPMDAADVAVFTAALRVAGTRPVEPTPALAAMMADGVFPDIADRAPAARPTPWRRARMAALETLAAVVAKLAGLGVAAKTAAVATVAVASVGAAGAGGALPEPAQDRVARIIERVTPFEAPDSGDTENEPNENADFGQSVSDDARDGGVDGQEISERAKENGNRPDDAGKPSAKPTPNGKGSGRPDGVGRPTELPGNAPTAVPNGNGSGRPDGAGKPTANPAGR